MLSLWWKTLCIIVSIQGRKCHNCGKRGYIAKMCQSKPLHKKAHTTRNSQPVHNVTDNSSDSEYQLFVVHIPNSNPLKTTLLVEGHQLTMKIDTGAAVSLVSEETVNSSFMKDHYI